MPESMLLLAIDTCGPTGSMALGQLVGGRTPHPGRNVSWRAAPLGDFGGVRLRDAPHGRGATAAARRHRCRQRPRRLYRRARGAGRREGAGRIGTDSGGCGFAAGGAGGKAGCVASALDAHRNEVFLRVPGRDGEGIELLAGRTELMMTPPPGHIAVCDESAAVLLISRGPRHNYCTFSRPPQPMRCGFARRGWLAGEFVDLALLDGNYLRRSDAEIFGEPDEADKKPAEAAKRRKRVPPNAVIQVRPMREEDLDEVVLVAASLRQAPYWPRETYKAALNPNATPRRIALAVEIDGKAVGLAVASLIPPQAELETIAVDTHYQRCGLARGLFAELAGRLRLAGVTEVILEVRASNQPALGLYQRLGFVQTGRRPGYYMNPPEPPEDAVLMRLGLEGS